MEHRLYDEKGEIGCPGRWLLKSSLWEIMLAWMATVAVNLEISRNVFNVWRWSQSIFDGLYVEWEDKREINYGS